MLLRENLATQKVFKDMGMNKWRETTIMELKKGIRVRLYSTNGRPLELGGEETFLTTSDAYQIDGVWVVRVKKA